jgi:PAS domain S-box-containing protein
MTRVVDAVGAALPACACTADTPPSKGKGRFDTVLLLNADGAILYASPSITRLVGYAPEELVGRSELDLVHPDDHPAMKTVFAESLCRPGQDKIVQYRYHHKEGAWHYLESIRTTRITDTHVRVVVVLQRDITAAKQSEEAVRAIESQYRCMIDNLEQSVFLKDRELRYVAANRKFCQGLGRTKADLVGKTDLDFHPRPVAEKYQTEDRLVLAEGRRVEAEEHSFVDGKLRTYRIVKTPARDEQGRMTGVLGITWDVTEQRALEGQLRQAQKMEAIGQLVGGMAHDFNNLLTAILGNIALTRGGVPENDPCHELLVSAEQAAARAAELTNRLLGFSRQTLLRPQPTNLQACVDETVRILRRTIDPRITLEVRGAADLWPVHADAGQLNQVLMNLCLNARDAMPDGGRLLLKTENVVLGQDYANLHLETRSGEFVRLSVEDTGHGILPEIRARIFEPFFTTKGPGKGTGLGLAMVFGIVKQHQGWIDCYSEVNQGTCFSVYLPRSTQPLPACPPPAPPVPNGGRETILLADDERSLRNLGATILRRYGYTVLLAEDGVEAVAVYRQAQGSLDLVILDLTMPRLSGHDAFRQIIALDPGARILFASGYSAEYISAAEHESIRGFVSKPYRPEELAHRVRTALDTRPSIKTRAG